MFKPAVRTLLIVAAGWLVPSLWAADELERQIRESIEPAVQRQWLSSAVVGILRGTEQPRVFTFGRARDDSPAPPDDQTLYEIGSITKTFTTTLLADMVLKGEVALEDTIETYLPRPARPPIGEPPVTLEALATHTSGLPRMPGNFFPANPRNPFADYSLEQMYDFLERCKLNPQRAYLYSNFGMGLLGNLLAQRANSSYAKLLSERVFDPLDMHNTWVHRPDAKRSMAMPHNADGVATTDWDIPTLAGAGAIRSCASDMLRFAAANLGIEPAEGPTPKLQKLHRAMALAQQPRRDINPTMKIGLGWHINPGTGVCWHNGQTGGFHAFLGLHRPSRTAVVVLSNTATMLVDQLGGQVGMLLRGEKVKPLDLPSAIQIDPSSLDRFVGVYPLEQGGPLIIVRSGDHLMASFAAGPVARLFASSPTKLFGRSARLSMTFTFDENGRFTSVGGSYAGKPFAATRRTNDR